jgi:hypothetical protein
VLRTGATVVHRSPAFRLWPDALRLPTAVYKKPKQKTSKEGVQNQTDQKIDNLAVLPGGI